MGTVTLEQVAGEELALPLRVQEAPGELVDSAKEGLLAPSVGVGLGVLAELLEEEVVEVVGPKGKHIPERTAVRHGHEVGEVTLGGRRVAPSGRGCAAPTAAPRCGFGRTGTSATGIRRRARCWRGCWLASPPVATARLPRRRRLARRGTEETLTRTRLGVSGNLTRTLQSTNPAEPMVEVVGWTQRNLKRWSSGEVALGWTAAGMLEAERRFRKVIGHRDLATLLIATERDHHRRHPAHLPTKEAATPNQGGRYRRRCLTITPDRRHQTQRMRTWERSW